MLENETKIGDYLGDGESYLYQTTLQMKDAVTEVTIFEGRRKAPSR